MNKKVFTLVELLAVIAILAILVIIALPNVMKLFNDAKEKAFTTELKEIYKVAQQQWIADSMFNTQEREYAGVNGTVCANKLDLTGRSELEYYIKIDKSGTVVTYKATDGSYQYSYSGTGLKIEDIGPAVQISKIEDESQIISITCNGASGGGNPGGNPGVIDTEFDGHYKYYSAEGSFDIYDGIPNNVTTYNSYQSAIAASGKNVFVRIGIYNDYIDSKDVGIVRNGEVYYLSFDTEGSPYDCLDTVITEQFNSIFGSNNCEYIDGGAAYEYDPDTGEPIIDPETGEPVLVAPGDYYYECSNGNYSARGHFMICSGPDTLSATDSNYECGVESDRVYCINH